MKLKALSPADQLEAFKSACTGQWDEIVRGNSKGGNAHRRTMDRLAAIWMERGTVQDVLLPYLLHEDERFRLAAATYLLKYGLGEPAVAVLRDLVGGSKTLVGLAAWSVLRFNRIECAIPQSVR